MSIDQLALCGGPLPKLRTRSLIRSAGRCSSSLEPQQPNPHAPLDLTPLTDRQREIVLDYAPPGHIFDVPRASGSETAFRHSSWKMSRVKIDASMVRTMTPLKRLDRFRNCGAQAWVERHTDGSLRVASFNCNDRLCEACGRGRAAVIAGVLQSQIEVDKCRFVTLTAAHVQMPLRDQIARIYQCFSNLRRHRTWKDHVTGGAAFCEIKVSARTGKWHVHLHLIVTGSYLPQRMLSDAWQVATGDSRIVDIRAIPESKDVARYVTKYVTKPIDQTVYADPDKLDEAVVALRGRRLCFTFGSWRGLELQPARPSDEGWQALERLDSIRIRADHGDSDAQRIIEALYRNRNLSNQPLERPPDE
jgi:Replication protein